jgi:cytochrome P450
MEVGNTPPVDIYSFFHYIPQSFFGNWITRSKAVGGQMNKLYSDMLAKVEQRRKKHGSKGSWMDTVLDQQEKLGLTRHQIYFLGGVVMEGGSDTSASIITSFIHAMTKWGHVLKKAQEEVDSVVGEDRTPLWSDYQNMPYVASIVKETMRWRPAVPLAFPHAATEGETIPILTPCLRVVDRLLTYADTWIDGKLIPKGATVIINCWGMHQDEARYGDPNVFNPDNFKGEMTLAPELFAGADYEKRDHYGYGSGRRICPGIHLAERNLFLAMAKLIWAFNIEPGRDENGRPIEPSFDPSTDYTDGFVTSPKDFPCIITPRSEKRRETIMREYQVAQEEVFSQLDLP